MFKKDKYVKNKINKLRAKDQANISVANRNFYVNKENSPSNLVYQRRENKLNNGSEIQKNNTIDFSSIGKMPVNLTSQNFIGPFRKKI